MVAFGIANQRLAGVGANRETTVVEEVVHPGRHVAEALVAVTIFIDEVFTLNLKADMKHAVGNRIDQVAAKKLGTSTIILNFVEPSF